MLSSAGEVLEKGQKEVARLLGSVGGTAARVARVGSRWWMAASQQLPRAGGGDGAAGVELELREVEVHVSWG